VDDARSLPTTPVLLYDGACGFCAGCVQFVLKREPSSRRDQLQFAPLQGTVGSLVRERHPELAGIDSVVWFEPSPDGGSRVRVRSSAALAALSHVGSYWRIIAAIGALVPRVVRDWIYDFVGRKRFELASPACLLPSPDERQRFLP
jgi:predicted DCC family thiol-disulfide oxidoreductase YuxK